MKSVDKESNNAKPIEAIFFDLGRVLVDFDNTPFFEGLASFSEHSAGEIESTLRESGIFRDYHNGKISPEYFYEEVLKKIEAKGMDFDKFVDLWKSIITTPNDGIGEVLDSINPDIKLMILSDTTKPHWKIIKEMELLKKYFPDRDKAILSFEIGVSKPDEKIYMEGIKRAECEFEECIFVDDRKENVDKFRSLGGNGIVYDCRKDSPENLRKRLSEYDIIA